MKRNWKFLISAVIVALLVGVGGCYYSVIQVGDLKSQISSLNKALDEAKQKVTNLTDETSDSKEKVVIYGDSRTGIETHKKILELMMNRQPEAVFNVGDIVEDGAKPEEWTVFNEITKEMRANTNFYPVLGNHEKDSPLFYSNFELSGNEQWYSINFNKVHFIVLNSTKDLNIGSEQYKWLENDLANIGKDIKFKVVIFHHPPYSTGKHDEDELGLRKSVVPLLERNGVRAVFSGHDHDYERSEVNGISYFVVGGGGAPIYPQVRKSDVSKKFLPVYHYSIIERKKDELNVRVYDTEDKLIDETTIKSQ
ncbi:MAG: metallophosphoesterase [Patescibacteria group bacterium]